MKQTMMPFIYFQGAVRPSSAGTVSIACNSLQYGTTCFAGIRGYVKEHNISIFRLYDHYERLMNAAKIMGYNYSISYDDFYAIIQQLVHHNQPTMDFYIRPFLYAPDEQLAPKAQGLNFDLAIYFVPFGHYFNPEKGMRLMISSWKKFPDSSIPTKAKAGGCYLNSFLATNEAHRCGYDEALLTDQAGFIVEASVANLLMVYHDRLIMPELGSALLEGITMRTVIKLLNEEGLSVNFERIDRSMVYTCQELMLLGTAAQIVFAESVDGRVIGEGKIGTICQLLRKKLQQILAGNHPLSTEWLNILPLKKEGSYGN